MKGRYLLFTVCLGCIAFYGAMAADDDTTARAATRRASGTTSAPTQSRQQVKSADTAQRSQAATSRLNTATTKSATGTTSPRTIGARTATVSESNRTAAENNARTAVSPRSGNVINVQARPSASNTARTTITAPISQSRSAAPTRIVTQPRGAITQSRGATSAASRGRSAISATVSRAAANTDLRDAVMGRDYKTCRQVYYDCMDEFCANKDSQLKRCACSSRLHEFDRVKKSLSNVEDKLLDFNQRLLTVNMDKEDADALFTATEGENAYNQTKDTSGSKKILDEISKKLNAGGGDSFSQNLSAISLSLNTDAAFDSVDSLLGASTTAKEGAALYNAALPVCREMAAEVCDDDALALAESGYQMTIEQDCNTVAKSYETQTDQAREKVREGAALLDISRLDIHQKRNSDDILTCKKKMLAQLSETSVCGDNLEKCLDMSGRYIDPSTGQAFLTNDLANLASLITRPEGNQTWLGAPGNDRFVSYLNSKKKYLEPAMENCQDIAEYVWDAFIEDALAQIKLAQDAKLEEVRQSCTTLTTQCLANTAKSLSDFDARALSTFGVKADKTVNDMCASVQNACTALLKTTQGDADWVGGMTQIATDKTYETIMQTCREVGRACIIQACKSISGNFGMCESNNNNSINRKSIINRISCWNEVKNCVAEAGVDAINNIFELEAPQNGNFYTELYGGTIIENGESKPITISHDTTCYQKKNSNSVVCVYDICTDKCACSEGDTECAAATSFECRTCRLAEKIWGNCEAEPASPLEKDGSHNNILKPRDEKTSTLLSWFSKNTGTDGSNVTDSCRDTSCPSGYTPVLYGNDIVCVSSENMDTNGLFCPIERGYKKFKPTGSENLTNCCRIGDTESNEDLSSTPPGNMTGNPEWCCIGTPAQTSKDTDVFYGTESYNVQTCNQMKKAVSVLGSVTINGKTMDLVCISDNDGTPISRDETSVTAAYPNGKTIKCAGRFVYVDNNGYHIDPHRQDTFMQYQTQSTTCAYGYQNGKWQWTEGCMENPSSWMVNIPKTQTTTK